MKKFVAVCCLSVTLALGGCKAFQAAPTPGVPQYYSQAALVVANFSDILAQSQKLFTSAHATGLVSDVDYVNGQHVFLTIAIKGDAIQSLIKSEASQISIRAAISDIVAQIGTMPSIVNIKNPTSQAEFNTLCVSMASILNATNTLVQTAN